MKSTTFKLIKKPLFVTGIFCLSLLLINCNQKDQVQSISKYSESKSAIETAIDIIDLNPGNIAIIYKDSKTNEFVSLIGEKERVENLFVKQYYATPQVRTMGLSAFVDRSIFSFIQNNDHNQTVHYEGESKMKVIEESNKVLESEGCVQVTKKGDVYTVQSCPPQG